MCSVCAEPPLLLACVNADNEFCTLADASDHFAVNLLEQAQKNTALVFAGLEPADTEGGRFATGSWRSGAAGSPVLEEALVSMDCMVDSAFTRGTHRVYIGKVVGITTTSGEPLLYADRAFARSQPLN